MRIVRWMCDVKVKDRVPSKELREKLELDDIISVDYNKTYCDSMGVFCDKKTLLCVSFSLQPSFLTVPPLLSVGSNGMLRKRHSVLTPKFRF